MKTKLLLASMLALTVQQAVIAQTDALGYTQVNMTMGAGYQNRVFVNLADGNMISQPATSWDVAFYRNSAYQVGTRINDAKDIEVYTASTNLADWDTINISNEGSWGEPLYNPDQTTDLSQGAFEQGPITSPNPNLPSTGWGLYNGVTHHIEGKAIFVLKYANGTYMKFAILDAFAGYTFKYSKWNGSSWSPTETKTIANGNDDAFFNYFSFDTGEKVPDLEPSRSAWDLVFTKYYTFYMGVQMYPLSGAIQSPNIKVAMVQPESQETAAYSLPASNSFSGNITTVGHSWKGIGTVKPDVVYYIKKGNDYYRMYFVTNGGASTGNMYFKYKKITATLGITEVGKKASFGIYPNPAPADKKVTVIFDIKEKSGNKGNVEVYDLTGKKVYAAELTNQAGFYKQDMNLSHLPSGNYMVKITYGGSSETKKLIVK
ncbi:T9SS C-terminal target domain-containing protein [Chryseobacterium indologenes]|uniref:T9SS type A sorting domain-containing protein n=2 Tax=Chryseobacterium indologenes TaxID=253 RepID=UPI000F50768D|nr:T9SS type A sorting domain-containing protein [Chryseobacterium indologenes]AYZ36566.1 T9SS C-terminal target domain-containing protein [Chryseobacterium indologenes]MEB4762059.1 T9SS type A sorting domain-containing protein [Chryseobacterium indologenes]VFA44485.1 Por secretion system C-terminal sorting domain [Chryseobacterium indologenes]